MTTIKRTMPVPTVVEIVKCDGPDCQVEASPQEAEQHWAAALPIPYAFDKHHFHSYACLARWAIHMSEQEEPTSERPKR